MVIMVTCKYSLRIVIVSIMDFFFLAQSTTVQPHRATNMAVYSWSVIMLKEDLQNLYLINWQLECKLNKIFELDSDGLKCSQALHET